MQPLTLAERRRRLALDHAAMCSMRGSTLGPIQSFRNAQDLTLGRSASHEDGRRGLVTAYEVTFCFPMLRAPGVLLREARVYFILPEAEYPFEAPAVSFAREAIPFCPHVAPSHGRVCLGPAWQNARGHWLLAQLVVHVMRLVNFDEPSTLDAFDSEAYRYAVWTLGGRPLNPGLQYPVLNDAITHGEGELESVPAHGGFSPRRMSLGAGRRRVIL